VAPYASVMQSHHAKPLPTCTRWKNSGARGERHGFMDAVDFLAPTAADRPLSEARPHAGGGHDASTGACRWWRCAADAVRQRARRWLRQPAGAGVRGAMKKHTAADHRCRPAACDQTTRRGAWAGLPVRQVPGSGLWQYTQLLNSRYWRVALRTSGAGVSRWNPTRRPDALAGVTLAGRCTA
jgi:hypothetical protein